MKIFGIGLNKTGTTSLGKALEMLGFKGHISANIELTKFWQRGDLSKIFEVAEENEIFEDWPWPLLYKELEKKYPDAKFILTTRKSSEIWYNSLCKHSLRTGPTEFRKIIYGFYMPQDFKKEHKEFYERHNQDVRIFFGNGKEEKLLEFCMEKDDDWTKLCEFTGVEAPQFDFPILNRSKAIIQGKDFKRTNGI